jgi:hypothetical protein
MPADDDDRSAKVLELRKAGLSFDKIAKLLDYPDHIAAKHAYDLAIGAGDARGLESLRLDALQAAVWARAVNGDMQAVAQVLAIMARRSYVPDSRSGPVYTTHLKELTELGCETSSQAQIALTLADSLDDWSGRSNVAPTAKALAEIMNTIRSAAAPKEGSASDDLRARRAARRTSAAETLITAAQQR